LHESQICSSYDFNLDCIAISSSLIHLSSHSSQSKYHLKICLPFATQWQSLLIRWSIKFSQWCRAPSTQTFFLVLTLYCWRHSNLTITNPSQTNRQQRKHLDSRSRSNHVWSGWCKDAYFVYGTGRPYLATHSKSVKAVSQTWWTKSTYRLLTGRGS